MTIQPEGESLNVIETFNVIQQKPVICSLMIYLKVRK